MDYEVIFRKKQHYVTVRNRGNNFADRKICMGDKHLQSIIKAQPNNTDIYITKYPKDFVISNIILDFDSDDLDKAYADAKHLKNLLHYKGVNTVIVESGSKGYHLYIQHHPICFKIGGFEPNKLFNFFVYFVLNKGGKYTTLDKVNTSAGLGGNIRVIGSTHPKTNNKCRIIEGEFKPVEEVIEYVYDCYVSACNQCKFLEEKEECVRKNNNLTIKNDGDPILNNDLRELMPKIYGVDVKHYSKGYSFCKCPFHSPDDHPSMLLTKEYYSCAACGEKGNIWTLRKKGVIDFDCEGKVVE